MNMRPFLAVLAVASLSLAGAGCTSQKPATPPPQAAPQASENQKQTLKGSLADFLKLGQSIQCDLAGTDQSTISGTAYVSGTDVRTDFVTKENATATYSGHSIYNGTSIYYWSDVAGQPAIKMNLADLPQQEGTKTKADMNASIASAFQNKASYHCSAWIPDNSIFTPPANITFSDLNEMMKQAQAQAEAQAKAQINAEAGTNGMPSKAAMCASCASLTDPAQAAQCKATLGC